jgi:hypothetical protein
MIMIMIMIVIYYFYSVHADSVKRVMVERTVLAYYFKG